MESMIVSLFTHLILLQLPLSRPRSPEQWLVPGVGRGQGRTRVRMLRRGKERSKLKAPAAW